MININKFLILFLFFCIKQNTLHYLCCHFYFYSNYFKHKYIINRLKQLGDIVAYCCLLFNKAPTYATLNKSFTSNYLLLLWCCILQSPSLAIQMLSSFGLHLKSLHFHPCNKINFVLFIQPFHNYFLIFFSPMYFSL